MTSKREKKSTAGDTSTARKRKASSPGGPEKLSVKKARKEAPAPAPAPPPVPAPAPAPAPAPVLPPGPAQPATAEGPLLKQEVERIRNEE
ncbi:hypothetical protein ATEIFO6365_0008011600 [Aspergillus terreus]|uniref:Uncharacterized protein n=1 Tax=Aspergillus terreus TaxID=33178 RepID=A0A5M3Z705_ASPTE|nr:hypothetical protein ATETN484_0010012500 [Aspergillus terreus]GFF18175.1 hypothetical protein ATEIFO6365_0008011600 [Aspergillus terreus]